MFVMDWAGERLTAKRNGAFLWLMELFYSLIMVDDCGQNSWDCTLKRMNFTICKLGLNFLNKRKREGCSSLWGTDERW